MSARLDAVQQRLVEHAQASVPTGLTEPDAGDIERWEAGQVWSHIAEFVPYWQAQLAAVIGSYAGSPVLFGRTKADAGRIAAIEMGRYGAISQQMASAQAAIAAMKSYVTPLSATQWAAIGQHPTLGEMNAQQIAERFVVGHLEEHADQLDGLRTTT